MKRKGTIIVLAKGADTGEVRRRLAGMVQDGLLDTYGCEPVTLPGNGVKAMAPRIREYDDQWGGPVWYIP